MSHQIKVPAAGDSITSASIGQWHKQEGEFVSKGDVIVTLETDKVSNELEAEVSGVLRLLVAEGEEVPIGALIASIEESEAVLTTGSAPAPALQAEEPSQASSVKKIEPTGDPVDVKVPAAGDSITSASIGKWNVSHGDFVTKGQNLVLLETDKVSNELEAELSGSIEIIISEGEEVPIGTLIARITPGAGSAPVEVPKEVKPLQSLTPAVVPVETASISEPAQAPQDDSSRTTRKKMSMLRRKISTHLVNAQQTAAILTTFNEVDMTEIMTLRKQIQEEFVAKHGVKLGFMSFFVKAIVQALKEVPQINGRIDGTDMIQNHFFDIGVAIGTEKGLIVPVLRDCDQKSFAEIEQDIIAYAEKAKEGKIEFTDLQGGVFTVSNGGVYGSLLSTPILNPPQSGILGMHTIQKRPIAVNDEVVIRPMMYLAFSYDHRLVDGKEAVTFLIKIKDCIENPTRLMLEV